MKGNPTVAAVIAQDMAALGARRCFGLLGTANFKITHALVEAGVELISARHEGNAACMADAYAKATGELTLVSVHSGPGLTNALTGIAEAAKSRTPLLVLAGDVPNGAVKSNFHIDQAEMVRAVGAVSERIHTARSARDDTLRAVTRALRDRQTVVLSLPMDVQDAALATNSGPPELPPAPGRLHPDPDAVGRLADALVRAERPLILGGRGAVVSDAEAALEALAERAGALLATTVCGHGLFAQSPWSLGICGGFSSPIADELIHESDFIAGFGASFTQWTNCYGQAHRTGRDRRADRRRSGEARLPDADPACRAGRRQGDRGGIAGRAGAARCGRAAAGPPQRRHSRPHPRRRQPSQPAPGLFECAVHRSAHAEQGGRCHPAAGPRGGLGLRPLLRLGPALSARPQRPGLVSQPFVPVGRPRPRIGDRPRGGEPRQARGARRRRRRLHDVDRRSRDRAAPRAPALHPRLQRRLLRGRSALLPPAGFLGRYRAIPRHRLRRHCARLRGPRRDGANARRSRSTARLGERGCARRVRDRWQDQSGARSRRHAEHFP